MTLRKKTEKPPKNEIFFVNFHFHKKHFSPDKRKKRFFFMKKNKTDVFLIRKIIFEA